MHMVMKMDGLDAAAVLLPGVPTSCPHWTGERRDRGVYSLGLDGRLEGSRQSLSSLGFGGGACPAWPHRLKDDPSPCT